MRAMSRMFEYVKTLVHENYKPSDFTAHMRVSLSSVLRDEGLAIVVPNWFNLNVDGSRHQHLTLEYHAEAESGGSTELQACTNIICLKYCRQHHKIKSKSTADCVRQQWVIISFNQSSEPSILSQHPHTCAIEANYLPNNYFTIWSCKSETKINEYYFSYFSKPAQCWYNLY